MADKQIFIKTKIQDIENLIYINQILPIVLTNVIIKKYFFYKPKFIYISSSRAKKGDKGITLYSTTKNSLSAFVKNMAMEYGNYGINFKIIMLGLFKGGLKNKLSKQTNSKILNRTYNHNYLEIEQLSKTLDFSIDDDAGNGSEIYCDNGYN